MTAKRAWLLVSSAGALGVLVFACHSDQDAGKRSVPAPVDKTLASKAPPEAMVSPQVPLSGHLALLAPDGEKKLVSLQALTKEFPLQEVETKDPNYGVRKRFFAIPLGPLLEKYLGPLAGARLLLQASDGYSVEVDAAQLLSEDAFLAVGDRAPGEFAPIGDRKVSAGPSYVVWRGDKYADDKKFPRPWSLVTIEKLDSSDHYEHTRPDDGFLGNQKAKRGYEIFSASCIRCHAINREGGRLGPDLNVPQNVLAYRPEEQVRAYIRDPKTFRYSSMPAHPDFSEADLDALIDYLRVMGENQSDPDAD